MVDNHGLKDCKYSNFCHYINAHEEFAEYFKQKKYLMQTDQSFVLKHHQEDKHSLIGKKISHLY